MLAAANTSRTAASNVSFWMDLFTTQTPFSHDVQCLQSDSDEHPEKPSRNAALAHKHAWRAQFEWIAEVHAVEPGMSVVVRQP
jgi:hypothetical protein